MHGSLVVAGHLVATQRLRGARRRAMVSARAALAWAADRGSPAAPGLGTLSVLLSDLLADGNELAEAMPLAVEGHRVLSRFADRPPLLLLLAGLNLLRLRIYQGDVDGATAVIAQLRPVVHAGPYAALALLVDAGEAQLLMAAGDTAAAVAWANTAEPRALPNVFRLQTHVFASASPPCSSPRPKS